MNLRREKKVRKRINRVFSEEQTILSPFTKEYLARDTNAAYYTKKSKKGKEKPERKKESKRVGDVDLLRNFGEYFSYPGRKSQPPSSLSR